jgi:tetratricopeptide (TPR) repeat protein
MILDVLWRSAALIGLGLVPWAAPLDVTGTTTTKAAVGALLLLALVALAVWVRKRSRAASYAAALAAGVALIGSAATAGGWAPLARAAWLMAPVVWAAIGLCVVAAGQKLPASRRFAVPLVTTCIAIGVVQLFVANARLRPGAAWHRAVLSRHPDRLESALALSEEMDRTGQHEAACRVLADCSSGPSHPCACGDKAAACAMQQGAYAQAAVLLRSAAAAGCEANALRVGLRAEALAGLGKPAEALGDADLALRLNPQEPHALFAKSRALLQRGDAASARVYAEQAVAAGHGLGAQLQLGMLAFQAGDLPRARAAFAAALVRHPDNVTAVYDLALVDHTSGKYRDAREGYLNALRMDPKHADSRHNLVVLTYKAGATEEAQHHLKKLMESVPGDPRIAQLQAMLSRPPAQ